MEIIGALKKSNSDSTIYFCEYREEDFSWDDIVRLLEACRLMQDLSESDIYCIAVESNDNLQNDQKLVGLTFRGEDHYISLALQEYADLDYYLNDLAG